MAENSMWSTWKPYAVIVVLAIAGFWWWNSQSSFAALKDGSYACQGVYVNDENKYEVLVDDAGNRLLATARVSGGDLVSLEGGHPDECGAGRFVDGSHEGRFALPRDRRPRDADVLRDRL